MFRKFFDAIKSLFSTLFGGKTKKTEPAPKPKPKPIDPSLPQDGSEVKPDTAETKDEQIPVEIDPNIPDVHFEPDEEGEEEVELPEPEEAPKPEPPAAEEKPEEPVPVPEYTPRYLWCLDNGHGKQTPGKRSPVFDDGATRFFEYEFNRDIVNRIIKELDKKGVRYFNVVPEVDIDDFLVGRVNRANAKKSDIPKIFVSIHSNAAPAPSSEHWGPDNVSGIETWFFHGSKTGQKIAGVFQKHLIEKTQWVNRHLKSRPEGQFYVLRKTKMPAVLTENGFYNNRQQAKDLMKDQIRQKIADAHVAAILEIEKNGL